MPPRSRRRKRHGKSKPLRRESPGPPAAGFRVRDVGSDVQSPVPVASMGSRVDIRELLRFTGLFRKRDGAPLRARSAVSTRAGTPCWAMADCRAAAMLTRREGAHKASTEGPDPLRLAP